MGVTASDSDGGGGDVIEPPAFILYASLQAVSSDCANDKFFDKVKLLVYVCGAKTMLL